MRLVPDGEKVRLGDLEPGSLFLIGDCIAVKSEYLLDSGKIEAIIVGSGEFFHGAKTVEEQYDLMVQPLEINLLGRCKECLHKRKYWYKPPECHCLLHDRATREDGFCDRWEPMPANKKRAYQLYGKEKRWKKKSG